MQKFRLIFALVTLTATLSFAQLAAEPQVANIQLMQDSTTHAPMKMDFSKPLVGINDPGILFSHFGNRPLLIYYFSPKCPHCRLGGRKAQAGLLFSDAPSTAMYRRTNSSPAFLTVRRIRIRASAIATSSSETYPARSPTLSRTSLIFPFSNYSRSLSPIHSYLFTKKMGIDRCG